MKVAIIGATGYGGLELIRYLLEHPFVEIASVHSQTETQPIDQVFPHLKELLSLTLEPIDYEKIMRETQLVFLATPSGRSKEIALPFIANDFPVIDLSGDFRLKRKGDYEEWYGAEALHFSAIQHFDYGLAEFRQNPMSKFVANPGCYATATELALAPLLSNQLVAVDSLVIDGKSGVSGAGKGLSAASHFANAHENMSVYRVNTHQHIPEIVQQCQQWAPDLKSIQFTTSLIPVTRGILITGYGTLLESISSDQLTEKYQQFYEKKPFIRVQQPGQLPSIKQVAATNFCDIGIAVNPQNNRVTVVSVIDNLGKGAAGQAVQNLNLYAGFPETAGLLKVPVYP